MKFECQHCGQRLAIGTLRAGAQVNCTPTCVANSRWIDMQLQKEAWGDGKAG